MLPKFMNKQGLSARNDGFTLIELMVVVMIIAILLAIAVPTFLGAREKSQNRAGQSNLRSALTATKFIYIEKRVYPSTAEMVTELALAEPSLTYKNNHYPLSTGAANASTGPKEIGVWVISNQNILLFGKSESGKCWAIMDNNGVAIPPAQPVGTSFGEITINPTYGCGSGSPWSGAGNTPTGF